MKISFYFGVVISLPILILWGLGALRNLNNQKAYRKDVEESEKHLRAVIDRYKP